MVANTTTRKRDLINQQRGVSRNHKRVSESSLNTTTDHHLKGVRTTTELPGARGRRTHYSMESKKTENKETRSLNSKKALGENFLKNNRVQKSQGDQDALLWGGKA